MKSQSYLVDTLEKTHETQMCRETMVENHCSITRITYKWRHVIMWQMKVKIALPHLTSQKPKKSFHCFAKMNNAKMFF